MHDLSPAADAHGVLEFHDDLLIRYKCLLCPSVIAKITQMDQQGKHIILHFKIAHIILKTPRIYFYPITAKHFHDIRPQSIEIHINISFQCIIRLRGSPITGKFLAAHRLHNRFRIVDMLILSEHIPIIPVARLSKIHVVFSA